MQVPATPVAVPSCSVNGSLIRLARTVVLIGDAFDANHPDSVWLVILAAAAAQAGG